MTDLKLATIDDIIEEFRARELTGIIAIEHSSNDRENRPATFAIMGNLMTCLGIASYMHSTLQLIVQESVSPMEDDAEGEEWKDN